MENTFFQADMISKKFGRVQALQDVRFSVRKGEILGLIGPNGAGKTTLFNVLTGFYRSSSGKVTFKGKDVTKYSPDKLAAMGMVRTFQIPRPFRELTVHDNVAVGTLFTRGGKKKSQISTNEFIDNILQGIKLFENRNDLSGELGYGKLKLLELGRSQGPAPDLLLLDEPFAGLSNSEIESVSKILVEMSRRGLTLIIVEHKLRDLMKLVNRIIVLFYGKKIADGTPDEIYQNDQVLKAYLGKRWAKTHA